MIWYVLLNSTLQGWRLEFENVGIFNHILLTSSIYTAVDFSTLQVSEKKASSKIHEFFQARRNNSQYGNVMIFFIQILREIIFRASRSAISAILTKFETLNLVFMYFCLFEY